MIGRLGLRQGRVVRMAVGPDRLVAVLPDGAVREWGFGSDAELDEALAAIRVTALPAGRTRPAVEWVLLPPLVDVRRVSLPRLRPEETTALLERLAARYFPAAREPQVVAWRCVSPRGASPADLLVAAASDAKVEALLARIDAAGLDPGDPGVAHDAWVAAAGGPATDAVRIDLPDRIELLGRRAGRLVDVAAVPKTAVAQVADRLRALAPGGGAVALDREDPAVTAARHADVRPPGLRLVSPRLRVSRERKSRRAAARLWALAATLMVAAALVELLGVHRELAAVRSERQALAQAAAEALDERSRIEELVRTTLVLDSLALATPAWSAVLIGVSQHLPEDAFLAAFRAEGDSVAIEGAAIDAAGVFTALHALPDVERVAANAPIRREHGDAGAMEWFTLAAQLRKHGMPGGP